MSKSNKNVDEVKRAQARKRAEKKLAAIAMREEYEYSFDTSIDGLSSSSMVDVEFDYDNAPIAKLFDDVA